MFELFPDLIEFADPADTAQQHATFADRARAGRGKAARPELPAPARLGAEPRAPGGAAWAGARLPARADAVSARAVAQQPARPAPRPVHRRRPFAVDRWLRVEQLADDFLALVGELRDVTDDERRRVRALPQTNSIEYDHEVSHWFTPAQVRTMYAHNPLWAALEERLYGGVAADA